MFFLNHRQQLRLLHHHQKMVHNCCQFLDQFQNSSKKQRVYVSVSQQSLCISCKIARSCRPTSQNKMQITTRFLYFWGKWIFLYYFYVRISKHPYRY
jgi:hypothetical protein